MTTPTPPAEERWKPVQVAAYLKMKYQDARNAMLEGRFGESEYDPKTRALTVSAALVREEKAKRDARKKSRKKTRPKKRAR